MPAWKRTYRLDVAGSDRGFSACAASTGAAVAATVMIFGRGRSLSDLVARMVAGGRGRLGTPVPAWSPSTAVGLTRAGSLVTRGLLHRPAMMGPEALGGVVSEKQYRDKIAAITKQHSVEETALGKARAAATKHRSDAVKALDKITPKTSVSSAKMHRRAAEIAESRAVAEDNKASKAAKKLGDLAKDLASAQEALRREEQSTQRRQEASRKTEARETERAEARRRLAEKAHAREVSRLLSPEVRYVHEVRAIPAPQPEVLRVLYMTANPELNLRTEAEVRGVRSAVRGALHRDLIEIDFFPAATPEDLLTGLNDLRPHVVHFAGHAGDAALLFDNGEVARPEGRDVPYELLARALAATDMPLGLLVLNGCDTLEGADILLDSTAAIIATADSIGDLAASTFAAKFYAAIASGQSIAASVEQGKVAVDFMGLGEGWKHQILMRPDLDPARKVLVKVPEQPPTQ